MHHVLFLQAGKTGKQKSNAAALHPIPWRGQQPGLGSGKSVIYNLKSESPNRKITACQCKWWCLQRPASLPEQLLTTTRQGMGMTRSKQAVLPGGMGDFSALQVLDNPLSRMLRHPAVLLRSAAPGPLTEGTQFLLRTRISVKNEVNAVSTVEKEARGHGLKTKIKFWLWKGAQARSSHLSHVPKYLAISASLY